MGKCKPGDLDLCDAFGSGGSEAINSKSIGKGRRQGNDVAQSEARSLSFESQGKIIICDITSGDVRIMRLCSKSPETWRGEV